MRKSSTDDEERSATTCRSCAFRVVARVGARAPRTNTRMTPSLLRPVFVAAAVSVLVALVPQRGFAEGPGARTETAPLEDQSVVAGERALERRLFAPCCYTQTLDLHESEVSHALRAEIRERLVAGERSEAIEQSLVSRYGEKIRAVPEQDPSRVIAPVLLLLAGVAGFLALRLVRGWQRRSEQADRFLPASTTAADAYDARLDAELGALD